MKATLQVISGDVFDHGLLPVGEARLVYADPPYTITDEHGYGCWPGARPLVSRMLSLGADDCAYVLHCGEWNLAELLPVIEELAPARKTWFPGQPKSRVLTWVKPWRRGWNRNVTVPFTRMWEPVVVWYGPAYKSPRGLTEADWICALRNERSLNGHATQKPDEVLAWLFHRMLRDATGRLAIDLFAGTGSAAIMLTRLGLDAIAVERDPFFADKIIENAALPAREIPGFMPLVATNAHGRPEWSTLGRVQIHPDTLDAKAARDATHALEARKPLDELSLLADRRYAAQAAWDSAIRHAATTSTIRQVAAQTGLGKSKVHRIIRTGRPGPKPLSIEQARAKLAAADHALAEALAPIVAKRPGYRLAVEATSLNRAAIKKLLAAHQPQQPQRHEPHVTSAGPKLQPRLDETLIRQIQTEPATPPHRPHRRQRIHANSVPAAPERA